jgi:hypothetical protein
VRVVKLPWAEPGSRFTELFEALAIEWLKHASQQAVGDYPVDLIPAELQAIWSGR